MVEVKRRQRQEGETGARVETEARLCLSGGRN
jgi:hypothetical protein